MIKQECFCDYCGDKCSDQYYELTLHERWGAGQGVVVHTTGKATEWDICVKCYKAITDTIGKLKGQK